MKANISNKLFAAAVLALGTLATVFGQESTAISADKALKSNARVNPSTLAMEMEIPLASYPGRGISGPVSISYSSKLWRMEDSGTHAIINNPNQCWKVGRPRFAELSSSGWTASTAVPYIEYVGYDNLYSEIGMPLFGDDGICSVVTYNSINYVRRIVVHMPGGGTQELRADDSVISYPTGQSSSNDVNNQANWNTTYYAVDGSNLIYVEDSTTGTYRLKLTNGSYVDFNSSRESVQWSNTQRTTRKALTLKDVNGNTVTYGSGSQTDTIGRTIPEPFGLTAPATPTTTNYNLPGFGTTGVLSYKLYWKKLKDSTAAESALTNFNDALCYAGSGLIYPGNPQPPVGSCRLFNDNGFGRVVSVPVAEFNPVVLKALELPDGRSYEFGYDVYGRINKITYPTGAYETFDYSAIPTLNPPDNPSDDIYSQVNHGVTSRSVYESVGATPVTWTYSTGSDPNPPYGYKLRTVAPDGTKTERYLKRGNQIHTHPATGNFGFDTPLAGMPYEERSYTSGTDTLVSKKITTWALTQLSISGQYSPATADWHPRVTKEEAIVYDTSSGATLSASTTTDYDGILTSISNPLNIKKVSHYAFTTTLGSLGALEKYTETDYMSDPTYTAINLRSLPIETRLKDPSGNVRAKAQLFYDESGYGSGGYRSQVTRTRTWHDIAANQYIDARAKYDSYGNLTEATDGRGHITTTAYSATYNYAYPTSVTTPVPDSSGIYGSSTAFTTSTAYDFKTGLPTSTTDANGQITSMSYTDPVTSVLDPLLRPRKVTAPNGHQTITEYGAGTSSTTRWIKSRSQIDANTWKEGYSWYDGLGRSVRSQSVDDDGDVFSLTCYDTMGRVSKATNPFRSYTGQTCSTTTGLEWTTNTFDSAGRPWKITTPDSAVVETLYSLATSGSPIGTAVTVKDQALKERRSITNALGQLTRVDEPTTAGLGAINIPNQDTRYAYDYLNNLTTVTQGVQTRTFTYDALSRLKQATNPESGTINYTYDANSNLATKTDARSISTTYTYDRLNRVTLRNYSETTPDVSYFYDNLANAKGKLAKVSSSVSTTEYTAFDIMGRVTAHKQTTDGTAYTTGYTYNLGGALIEETYPSGRVVKNTLDATGDLSMVQSKKNAASGFFSYADAFSYTAAGAVSSMQLGNGKWESTTFNNRLQPEQMALGTVQNGTDKLKLNYTYGGSQNNGNVLTQTITVPGLAQPFIQTYTYDELNRLKTATETNNGSGIWNQVYGFDRYGNRNITSGTGVTNFSFSANRITAHSFDAAGNTTNDGTGKTFTYDAENKQTLVNNGSTGQYFYDGDGKRVKKYVQGTGETTIFVYDAAGKLVAEYSTVVASANDAKVAYLTNDHLGSPRINTDQNGTVTARHDYHPFGEEILTPQRTSAQNYVADTVRKQFTGYERDIESDLDFAQARYYNKNHGRFTSVDPEGAGAYEENPQSWNAYAYVGNNPLNVTDPDGEKWKVCDNQGNCTEISDADARNTLFNRKGNHPEIIRKDGKIFDEDGNVSGTYVRTSFDDLSDTANSLIFGPNSIGEQGIKKGKLVGALAGGAVVVGACIALCPAAATAAAAIATRAGATSVLSQVSKGNLKHISKHLPNFLKLDASMTLEKVVAVGLEITKIGNLVGTPGGRKVFEATVNIGGKPTTVRAVLNTEGTLRSVHIRK